MMLEAILDSLLPAGSSSPSIAAILDRVGSRTVQGWRLEFAAGPFATGEVRLRSFNGIADFRMTLRARDESAKLEELSSSASRWYENPALTTGGDRTMMLSVPVAGGELEAICSAKLARDASLFDTPISEIVCLVEMDAQ